MNAKIVPIDALGKCSRLSPFSGKPGATFLSDEDSVIYNVHKNEIITSGKVLFFSLAGPRKEIYFDPGATTCGIVTCGGLCPGLNDVIRAIVIELYEQYGVNRVLGFRYGYLGLSKKSIAEPLELDPDNVGEIHSRGGTILSSSRGVQDISEMVQTLVDRKVKILFTVGGDGTMRGAMAIVEHIKKRGLGISVIAVPKTIDNDINYVRMSFGFRTAVQASVGVISSAHMEAKGAQNGIGLVKLMGRYSGFVAAYAALANSDVNICLVPEVPFHLEGKGGLYDVLHRRLQRKGHVVIVVAEGAGQNLIEEKCAKSKMDASGNIRPKDVGIFLKDEITEYFERIKFTVNLKYINPSYMIRSVPANAMDSAYCLALGQTAVHAGMAGKTNMVVGFWNDHFIYVPIPMAVENIDHLNPNGRLWKTVMESTLQPYSIFEGVK